jgi:CubicO group peptidase (beta-lactamase class C family)
MDRDKVIVHARQENHAADRAVVRGPFLSGVLKGLRRGWAAGAALALLCGASAASAQPAATQGQRVQAPGIGALTDQFMVQYMKRWNMPGATIAVARNGRLVYSQTYGYADVGAHRPPTPQTPFRIASASKPITAIAIFRLLEATGGDLNAGLDRPVFGDRGYLPDFTQIRDPRVLKIRLRDLLQHTGGWNPPDGYDPQYDLIRIARAMGVPSPADHTSVIHYVLMNDMLDEDPGKAFHYSNFGYNVLGRVVERLSLMSYEQYVQQMLATLGIRDMLIAGSQLKNLLPQEARYYDDPRAQPVPNFFDGGKTKGPQAYNGFSFRTMDAHGGWLSTPLDMLRILAAVTPGSDAPQLLRPDTIKTMTRDVPGIGNPSASMGWVSNDNGAAIGHAGALESSTLSYMTRRADGVSWAVIFNRGPYSDEDIAGLSGQLLGGMDDAIKQTRDWPAGTPLTQ